jgi:hypothetical protein
MIEKKIKIAWAKKLRTISYEDLPQGLYYLRPANEMNSKIRQKDYPNRDVVSLYGFDGIVQLVPPLHVIPLGDWDQMCKWCANGYKIEDLYSDEFGTEMLIGEMIPGMVAEVVSWPSCQTMEGEVLLYADTSPKAIICMRNGERWDEGTLKILMTSYDIIVRPLGPGDTITIEIAEL